MITPINVIRDDIRAMTAYAVADVADDFIKLDAMESPYHPFAHHPELMAEWQHGFSQVPIHLYPNSATCGLQDILRQVFGISDDAKMILGNGSDELIQLLTMLVARPNATVLALEPSFVMYRHNAMAYGMNYVGVPLNEDFTMNLANVLAAIEQHQPSLIFIAYPNNPTGVCFQYEDIEKIISVANGIVVVDEAYGAFNNRSFLANAGKIDNLVVVRTLSKIGFAGIRLGYASGCAGIMNELAKIVPPYNMNQLSLFTAKFAMKHAEVIEQTVQELRLERERILAALMQMKVLTAFPSSANFITVRAPDAVALFNVLKQNKILIKNLHGVHPLLSQCVRITIGSPEQNNKVLAVIKQFYEG